MRVFCSVEGAGRVTEVLISGVERAGAGGGGRVAVIGIWLSAAVNVGGEGGKGGGGGGGGSGVDVVRWCVGGLGPSAFLVLA